MPSLNLDVGDPVDVLRDGELLKQTRVAAVRSYTDGSSAVWLDGMAIPFEVDGSVTEALKKSHGHFRIERSKDDRPTETDKLQQDA